MSPAKNEVVFQKSVRNLIEIPRGVATTSVRLKNKKFVIQRDVCVKTIKLNGFDFLFFIQKYKKKVFLQQSSKKMLELKILNKN